MMLTICLAKLLFCGTQILIKVFDSLSQEARIESEVRGYKIVTIVLPSGEQRAVILLIIITN